MENLLVNNRTISINAKEPILYHTELHWTASFFPMIYTVIGSIGILPLFYFSGILKIIALLLVYFFCKGVFRIMKNRAIKIKVTEDFLSISSGVLTKTVADISLAKMEGIWLQQNFLGKMFNYGTLIISTGRISCSYSIKNPMEMRNILLNSRKYKS